MKLRKLDRITKNSLKKDISKLAYKLASKSLEYSGRRWMIDEDVKDTPKRFAKAWLELIDGYSFRERINVTFTEESDMECKPITFISTCEHHLLPFVCRAYIIYIPNKKVLGLSKLPLVAEKWAHRYQLQERLAGQIADDLMEITEAEGVMVLIKGIHTCECRKRNANGILINTALRGTFIEDSTAKMEGYEMIKVADNSKW